MSALGADPDLAVLASLQEALQRAKESSSPSTHVQAEPGESPDAHVAEAQARVSRLQAALDMLGADIPDAELLKVFLDIAKRQCRVQPVGERLDSCLKFVERAQGGIETTELRDLRREVEQLRREWNEWLAKPNSQRRRWVFSVFPDGKFDRRSRRQAPLSRARDMRHQVLWFRNRHSKYGLRGVRVGEASHPGPAVSRYFALTEVDSDAEDEDTTATFLRF